MDIYQDNEKTKPVSNVMGIVCAVSAQLEFNSSFLADSLNVCNTETQSLETCAYTMNHSMSLVAQSLCDLESQSQSTRAQVSLGLESSKEIVNLAEVAYGQIAQLNQSSEQINEIVQLIEKISQETKLLALNAKIEAARAGSSGVGFGVVANEVKELSEQTKKSVLRIAEQIKGVRENIQKVSGTMEQVLECSRSIEQVQSNTYKNIQSQEEKIGYIEKLGIDVSQKSQDVADGVSRIKNMVGECTVATEEMKEGNATLSKESQHLQSLLTQTETA